MVDKQSSDLEIVNQLNELTDMARRGRSSVVNTGPMMLIWGGAILAASLCEALSQRSVYTLAGWVIPVCLAFLGSLIVVGSSVSDNRAVTWRSRAMHRVWVAAGAAIIVFNVGEELRRVGLQSESEAATALILAVAVMATAELANRGSLLYAGVGWLIVALTLFAVADVDAFLTILAVGAIMLQIIPGILLLRDEWKA